MLLILVDTSLTAMFYLSSNINRNTVTTAAYNHF